MNVCEENSNPLEQEYSPGPLFAGQGLKVEKSRRRKVKQKQMGSLSQASWSG